MTVELETDRLILRELRPEDVEDHIAMMLDPETARFLSPTGAPRDRADEWRAVACYIGHWRIRGFGFMSVIEKATGAWVGRVGPWMPEGWPGLECGWAIRSDRRGKGYAPEAAIAAVKWTFDRFPDLPRIISVIDPANTGSQAVARKIGESKSGEQFRFHTFTLDVWSAERNGWLGRFF